MTPDGHFSGGRYLFPFMRWLLGRSLNGEICSFKLAMQQRGQAKLQGTARKRESFGGKARDSDLDEK